jgi:uncharacterized protein (DUF2267 family)
LLDIVEAKEGASMDTPDNSAFQEDLATRRNELTESPVYEAFLADLGKIGGYDRDFAEQASTSVLCILDQELVASNISNPEERLPAVLQDLMRGCNRPGERPPEGFDPETLIYTVGADLDLDPEPAQAVVRNVFAAVRHQLTHGQVGFVARKLPSKIQNLWYGHEKADARFETDTKPRDR